MKLELGTYRVVDAQTGKVRGRAYKTLPGAECHARHLTAVLGRVFVVARVKAA